MILICWLSFNFPEQVFVHGNRTHICLSNFISVKREQSKQEICRFSVLKITQGELTECYGLNFKSLPKIYINAGRMFIYIFE